MTFVFNVLESCIYIVASKKKRNILLVGISYFCCSILVPSLTPSFNLNSCRKAYTTKISKSYLVFVIYEMWWIIIWCSNRFIFRCRSNYSFYFWRLVTSNEMSLKHNLYLVAYYNENIHFTFLMLPCHLTRNVNIWYHII